MIPKLESLLSKCPLCFKPSKIQPLRRNQGPNLLVGIVPSLKAIILTRKLFYKQMIKN